MALIIHMRKSRGNISASTRSGYAEGREKWWRHPQHRGLNFHRKTHLKGFSGEGMSIYYIYLRGRTWILCVNFVLFIGVELNSFLLFLQETKRSCGQCAGDLYPTILVPRERNHLLESVTSHELTFWTKKTRKTWGNDWAIPLCFCVLFTATIRVGKCIGVSWLRLVMMIFLTEWQVIEQQGDVEQ